MPFASIFYRRGSQVALVNRVMGTLVDTAVLRQPGGNRDLNMTHLALNLSEDINGVAKRHAEVSRGMFPG